MSPEFITTHAKINLTLDILGKRQDGYHDLKMVMQSVSLGDSISMRRGTGGGIQIHSNLSYLPVDKKNHIYQAATAFFSATGVENDGISVAVEKRIPVAAGLAGGSSDAAGALILLDRLFDTHLTADELESIGLRIGADVPFCLHGGTCLAEGVGERLTELPKLPSCHIVLCKPPFGLSTAKMFAGIHTNSAVPADTDGMIAALRDGDLSGIARRMKNMFTPAAVAFHPEISVIIERLKGFGALGAEMSGSGPTVFGVFGDKNAAEAAYNDLSANYREVFLTTPV